MSTFHLFAVFWLTDSVQGARCDIDPESDVHDDYLGEFKSMVVNKMRNSIDLSLINDPDCIKGRKKTVQVCMCVCLFCYLCLLIDWENRTMYFPYSQEI